MATMTTSGSMSQIPGMQFPGSTGGQTVPAGGVASQNVNPLGNTVFNTLNQSSPVAATLPQYPGLNITVPGGIGGTSPAGAPTTGGFTGAGNINAATHQGGDFTMLGDFQQTYGQGTGTALANILGGLGTSTSQAEQLMLQPTMQAANQQLANIQASQAAQGVSADSSTAALTAAGLGGQVTSAIAGEMGNIGLNEERMLLGALTGEGQAHGSDVSGWDEFGNVMSGIGQAGVQLGSAALLGGAGSGGAQLISKLFG